MSDAALGIAHALRAVAAEERDLITSGRLTDLEPLGERRTELLARLAKELPAGELPVGDLRAALEEVQEMSKQSLVLLCALRDELARELDSNDTQRRAIKGYGDNGAT